MTHQHEQNEFQQLVAHLIHVKNDPSTLLDAELLETAGDVLVPQLDSLACGQLVVLLGSLFVTLQQDPSPAAVLAQKVLRKIPPSVLASNLTADTLPLDLGLQPNAHPSMRELVLMVLETLSLNRDFIAQLAITQRTLFVSLIELWLCVSDIGSAEKAETILFNFLETDISHGTDGLNLLGPVWKTIFHDKDVYSVFYNICRGPEIRNGTSRWPPDRQVYPRGRLLGWLPKVAVLKWPIVASSQLPEIEQGKGPLLDFAVDHMKGEDDVLAHLQWINFCTQLLIRTSSPVTGLGHVPLEFLISHGAHAQILSYYLDPHDNPMNSFLRSEAGNYVSIYMTEYSNHFLGSADAQKFLDRLNTELDIPPSRWPYATSIPPDLKVLISLDRKYLADISSSDWDKSPLSYLSPKPLNSNALSALAAIFRGSPHPAEIRFPQSQIPIDKTAMEAKQIATRQIYWTYMSHNPDFWPELIKHAKNEAFPERAIAALSIIDAVIHASWISLPADPDLPPSPPILHVNALPYVLPYLNLPAPSHTGGWAIQTAKYEVLEGLDRLMDDQPAIFERTLENWDQIRVAVKQRLRAGVSGRGSGIGGDVATLA